MTNKGSFRGECVTPGCTRKAAFIAIAEAPRAEAPHTRYRCLECCDLIDQAAPRRDEGVYPGQPGWDNWCTTLYWILAQPLRGLEAAADADTAEAGPVYTVAGESLAWLAEIFRTRSVGALEVSLSRGGVKLKVDGDEWTPPAEPLKATVCDEVVTFSGSDTAVGSSE